MEGRDIGTVVFPDAEVKIFLDADPSVREERRVTQVNAQDDPARAEKLKQALRERDRRDTYPRHGPAEGCRRRGPHRLQRAEHRRGDRACRADCGGKAEAAASVRRPIGYAHRCISADSIASPQNCFASPHRPPVENS